MSFFRKYAEIIAIVISCSAFVGGYQFGHNEGYRARQLDEATEQIQNLREQLKEIRNGLDEQLRGQPELSSPLKEIALVLGQEVAYGINECSKSKQDCAKLNKAASDLQVLLKVRCGDGVESACSISKSIASALNN